DKFEEVTVVHAPVISRTTMAITPIQASAPASLIQLAGYFLRLGCFGFGGPIALVGYMQKELVEERQWIAREDHLDGLALFQLAPGPLAAQLAMYLGYVRAGLWGATVVGAVFILPSFLMVIAIGEAYVRLGGTRVIAALFYGIGAAVIGIIARSAMKLMKMSLKRDWVLWGVFLALALSTAITERESVWLFLAGGLVVMALRAWPVFSNAGRSLHVLAPFGLTMGTTGGLFAFFLKS